MLKLANIFGNGCVLQQRCSVPIFGRAGAGDRIVVRFGTCTVGTVTDADGRFTAHLPAMEATAEGKPLTVKNTASGETFEIEDVLVGEVWLTSGQSNMSLPIDWFARASAGAGEDAIKTESEKTESFCNGYPLVRCARVCDFTKNGEDGDYENRADWLPFSRNMSIVSSVFGTRLYQTLGVPIGLLNCSYSGSGLFQWTDKTFVYNFNMLPATGYAVKGFLWYQGEHDSQYLSMTEEYPLRFKALVDLVRETFPCPDAVMPVVAFQLPRFNETELPLWSEMRLRQMLVGQVVENYALVCTMDHGSVGTIHPVDKVEISIRAAETVLDRVYHLDGHNAASPRAVFAGKYKGQVFVCFDRPIRLIGDTVNHLVLSDGDGKVLAYTAGVDGDRLILDVPKTADAKQICYQMVCDTDPNLYGDGDWPVFPFRFSL